MIEFLVALLIVGIITAIAMTTALTIERFRDKRIVKRLREEYMNERGGTK